MSSEKISYEKDLKDLHGLDSESIVAIAGLLENGEVGSSEIRSVTPDYFLRLLLVLKKIHDSPEQFEGVKDEISPLLDWFEGNIPNILGKPGIDAFLKTAAQAMQGHTVLTEPASVKMNVSKSLGRINAFSHLPFLVGEELLPSLRVFFMNNEEVILDSAGDWDDWLFVVTSLLRIIDKQAKSIGSFPEAWTSVPWDNVRDYMLEIRKSMESLELQLQEHDPARSDDSIE